MKTKDQYIDDLSAKLKEWNAQIDLLAAKIEGAAVSEKHKYAEELDALRAKQNEAAEKMKELKEASDSAWETVKESADKIGDELRTGLAEVTSKFK